MIIPAILLISIILWLIAEAATHASRLGRIPLRIAVSGTRGKTGTARDIASVLRSSGMTVLAKTTGSEPRYILPDGSEEPVPRRGIVSIIEQKRVVARAAGLHVDCLVTEIMSIRPENHRVESHKLLKPHITVLTNFRADHLDVTGSSAVETESVFLNDIVRGTSVFVHRNHISQLMEKDIAGLKAILHYVDKGASDCLNLDNKKHPFLIAENLDLVYAVSRHLKIDKNTIAGGIESARHDRGRPGLFRFRRDNKTIWFANTFAANDPVSTEILKAVIIEKSGITYTGTAGLLSLRSDRTERTGQWIKYLKQGGGNSYKHLYVTGNQKHIVKRNISGTLCLQKNAPEYITNKIIDECDDKTVIFGLANIAGTGNDLAEYWRLNGDEIKQGGN